MALSYSSVQTMTITGLNSLGSSATVAWQSAVQDNSTDLYEDIHLQVILDMANTAPANDKCLYVLAYSGLETTYSNPASGTEGSITLTNFTNTGQNARQIGIIPYTTQDEVIESSVMSVAEPFGFILPIKWGIIIVNYSGAAIAASGNSVKWRGVKHA